MAYRSVLGGSPLGLIGVRSAPNSSGLASFNIDKARNVNVQNYNKSRAGSIIGGRKNLRAWQNYRKIKTSDGEVPNWANVQGGTVDQEKNYVQDTMHADSIYDMSVLNIIEKLASTQGALRPTDFAYLKDLGVYPNNRLMIARRFAGPAVDNVVAYKTSNYKISAIATLMQYLPQEQEFLSITFGEEWEAAEADFTGVVDSLGKDLGLSNLGGIGGAAGNLTPLPGFTEIFQREFLASIGLLESSAANQIPAGNPNLIKEAKRRKTIGYSEAGSGLNTTLSIKMKCEYELKYISGIDPTIVWMDIIANIGRFGTSESSFYGLSGSFAAKLLRWMNNPASLISDVFSTIGKIIGKIAAAVREFINKAYNLATQAASEEDDNDDGSGEEEEDPYKDAKAEKSLGQRVLGQITKLLGKVSTSLIAKYRVRVQGIIRALTGAPSCPWHISIGNPLRPSFCSGDMLVKNVTLGLGPQLAFNDLPSTITVDFSMENARALGLQEIMAKFNAGYLRSVDVQKSYFETQQVPTDIVETKQPDGSTSYEPAKNSPIKEEQSGAMPGESWIETNEKGESVLVGGSPTTNTQNNQNQSNTNNSNQNNTTNNSGNTNTNANATGQTPSTTTSATGQTPSIPVNATGQTPSVPNNTNLTPIGQTPSITTTTNSPSGGTVSGSSENKTSALNASTSQTNTDLINYKDFDFSNPDPWVALPL